LKDIFSTLFSLHCFTVYRVSLNAYMRSRRYTYVMLLMMRTLRPRNEPSAQHCPTAPYIALFKPCSLVATKRTSLLQTRPMHGLRCEYATLQAVGV